MPYITQDKRDILNPVIDALHRTLVDMELDFDSNNLEGNLNYVITRLLRMCYGQSYGEMNDAIGVLQCVMLEHYRTVAVPYEEQKKFENGDVEVSNVAVVLDEVVINAEDDIIPDANDGC